MRLSQLLTLIALIVIAIGAFFFALNTAHRSTVLTTDSIVYIDTARHIARGQGITTSILKLTDTQPNPPQTQYPPLYSILMAPLIAAGVDPIFSGRLISAIAFALTILLVGLWIWRRTHPITGIAAAALLTTLPSITGIAAAVWADSLYTLLVTGLAILGTECIEKPSRLRWFALGSLVGVAVLAKYLGLTLFGILALFVIIRALRSRNVRAILAPVNFAILGATIFIAPLLLRNILTHQPIGGAVRELSTQPLGSIILDAIKTVGADFSVSWFWRILLIVVVFFLVTLLLTRAGRTRLSKKFRSETGVLLLVTLAFIVGLIAARLTIDTDRIYTRFVMPVYPTIIMAIVLMLHETTKHLRQIRQFIIPSIIALAAIAYSVKQYNFSAGTYRTEPSSRANVVSSLTTNRDLIIGNHAPEYTLYLERASIRLRSTTQDPELTPELLTIQHQRWSQYFYHIYLALSPNLDQDQYGSFAASLSRKTGISADLRLITDTRSLVLYQML
jgi:4-amino-4-deoxy-L-arabinose transferase-like glycosyltransferase